MTWLGLGRGVAMASHGSDQMSHTAVNPAVCSGSGSPHKYSDPNVSCLLHFMTQEVLPSSTHAPELCHPDRNIST